MSITIKVVPSCRTLMPVFSNGLKGGRILLREEYCQLPAGHNGPHRSESGGVLANDEGNMRLLEQGKI